MHKLTDWNLAHLHLKSDTKELYQAIIGNNCVRVEAAISKDPDLTHANLGDGTYYMGFRPLHWAAANGYLEIIKKLKQYGADFNQRAGNSFQENGGVLPLETAAHYLWETHHQERSAILRELSPDPKEINSEKELLYLGAITNNRSYIDEAVKRKVNVNMDLSGPKVKGFSAIHWAAKYGSLESLLWLIGKGADIDLKTAAGLTYKQVLEANLLPEQKIRPFRAIAWIYRKSVFDDMNAMVSQLPESMLTQLRIYLNLKDAMRFLELFVPQKEIKNLHFICQQCTGEQYQNIEGLIRTVLDGTIAPIKMMGLV